MLGNSFSSGPIHFVFLDISQRQIMNEPFLLRLFANLLPFPLLFCYTPVLWACVTEMLTLSGLCLQWHTSARGGGKQWHSGAGGGAKTLTACCLHLCLFVSCSCQRAFSASIIQSLNLITTASSHPLQIWMVPCHGKILHFPPSCIAFQSIHHFCI